MNPPLKWHGGKHYLAPHIHKLAMQFKYTHRCITHAGGLQELWMWDYRGTSECVNDLNGQLTNFWNVLRDEKLFADFKRRVEALPFSEPLFESCKPTHYERPLIGDILEQMVSNAVTFFIRCRQSMSGRMKDFTPMSKTRVRRGMNEQVAAWLSAVEDLPIAHDRLKRVVIYNKKDVDFIRQQDGPTTLFYCDPPYLPETRVSSRVYAHEMTYDDHVALLKVLANIKGRFILSGYDNALYGSYQSANDWNFIDVELPNNAATGATKRRMSERLWYSKL